MFECKRLGLINYRVKRTYSEAWISADRVDSTLSLWNFWTIGKERTEVMIFRLGLLKRMFRVPRICYEKISR